MKKYIKIIGIVLFMIILTGCNDDKKEIDGAKFTEIVTKSAFKVVKTETITSDMISNLYTATGIHFNIKFYEGLTDLSSVSYYNDNKTKLSDIAKNNKVSEDTGSNFSKYVVSTPKTYYVISRVNTTYLSITAPANYQTEVDAILVQLGY